MPAHTPTWTHTFDAGVEPKRLIAPEWLLTNGTGGYAAGTALGVNTRRYHGLLVAAANPPVGRVVVLNQLLDQLILTAAQPEDTSPIGPPALPGAAGGSAGGNTSGNPAGGISGGTSGGTSGGGSAKQTVEFTTLLFPDPRAAEPCFIPDGFLRLKRFEKGLSVRWTYAWGPVQLQRELILHWKQQAVTLRYTVTGLNQLPTAAAAKATLRLGPMITLRDFHSLLRRGQTEPFHLAERASAPVLASNSTSGGTSGGEGASITASHWGLSCTLACRSETGSDPFFRRDDNWWYNIHYPIDQRRGQDDCEDHFVPGWFEAPLDPTEENIITLTAALGREPATPHAPPSGGTSGGRADHLRPLAAHIAAHTDIDDDDEVLIAALAQAADDFVVDRTVKGQKLATIIAGYPWFADWGRDTFIALPGLLLCTGRFDEARATLHAFAQAVGQGEHEGLVPNRFDDYDDSAAHYNTVDASLWFVHAALQYVHLTRDTASWRDWLAAACVRIIDAYAQGTAYGIAMQPDGLITAGSPDTQLTWMDAAAVDDQGRYVVFTPRFGKAVEINALWYNALLGLAEGASAPVLNASGDSRGASRGASGGASGGARERYAAIAQQVEAAFTDVFWDPQRGCLFDHVTQTADGQVQQDASIRPNQVLAVSLPRSPLNPKQKRSVMAAVKQALLTPAGLRTLPRDDPNYHGHYAGPQFARDAAYHTGTIWPWLIGPYAEGVLRAGEFSPAAKREARAAIDPLIQFLRVRGLGQLYEIHQAEPIRGEHPPRGCFAQAWSVAEVLRVLWLLKHGG